MSFTSKLYNFWLSRFSRSTAFYFNAGHWATVRHSCRQRSHGALPLLQPEGNCHSVTSSSFQTRNTLFDPRPRGKFSHTLDETIALWDLGSVFSWPWRGTEEMYVVKAHYKEIKPSLPLKRKLGFSYHLFSILSKMLPFHNRKHCRCHQLLRSCIKGI